MSYDKIKTILEIKLKGKCPECFRTVDYMAEYKNSKIITPYIFKNDINGMKGKIVECPSCGKLFKISEVKTKLGF